MIKRKIGGLIEFYRKENKLTQVQLAKKLGISHRTISSWESDRTEPNEEMLVKLANALDVTTDVLLGGAEVNLTFEELQLIGKYRSADDRTRQIVRFTLGL